RNPRLKLNAYIGLANNPITFVDSDGRQDTGYTRRLDRQFATPEGARKTIEANRSLVQAALPHAKALLRVGWAASFGTFKLVTGVLGASGQEERVVETIEGVRNLPDAAVATVRDWDTLSSEEKTYRLATAALIVWGAYKLASGVVKSAPAVAGGLRSL